MKRLYLLICLVCCIFIVGGCSSGNSDPGDELSSLYAEYPDSHSLSDLEYEVGTELQVDFITMPKDYDISNIKGIISEGDEIAEFHFQDGGMIIKFIEEGRATILFECDGIESNSCTFVIRESDTSEEGQESEIGDVSSGKASSSQTNSNSSSSGKSSSHGNSSSASGNQSSTASSGQSSTSSGSQASNTDNSSSSVSKPSDDGGTVSAGKRNALQTAKNYLSVMPFSKSGLVNQLEYEGFSTEESTYAANNCGADWNQQALKSAKNYLNVMPFSKSGLVNQLEYEGFTSSQANYGANNCGADWNQQAAKKAKDYLDIMSFSRAGLIEQLKYDGFTQSQAEYGANSVGL